MESTLTPGQSFSHYKILSHLGAGGMGEVWLARDTTLDRRVALKILPERFTQDEQLVRRFVQEARAASALNHPNIITIYEIGHLGATQFIATEYVEGRTLRDWLSQEPLSIDTALDVAVQVAGALAAAHAAGIIHRDIKPENVMLRPDGLVKVLDFGLAKLTAQRGLNGEGDGDEIDTEAATALKLYTGPNAILGTTSYMSPEQARGEEIDGRSDCFSLGVMLYEMLARRRPFNGRTTIEILAAILEREPEPLAEHAPDLPFELRRIVTTTLSKSPSERYPSAQELATELKSVKTEREFSARSGRMAVHTGEVELVKTIKMEPVVSQQLTQPPAPAAPALPRWAWTAIPALLLLITAAWWWSARRGATSNPGALKTVEVANWRGVPGEVYSAGSLSPDGKLVAFAQADGEGANIWAKGVATGRVNQITKDQFSNLSPVWSPEGDEIAFFSNRGNQSALWRMPAPFGGAPTRIVQLANLTPKLLFWSPRGRLYYAAEQKLFAYDFNAQRVEPIQLPPNANVQDLSIAPDEARIAWIDNGKDGRGSVWTMPLPGGQPVRVAEHAMSCKNTTWAADSRRVLYSAQIDGTFQIFAARIDGGAPVQLTLSEQDALVLAVSRDGAKVLYGWSKEEADIWAVEVATGAETALTSDLDFELWPEVAPDGKTLAFQAVRNLSQGDKLAFSTLMTKAVDPAKASEPGGMDAQPAPLAANVSLPRWSPDGKRLAFLRAQGGTFNLWTARIEGGEEHQLTTGGIVPIEHTVLPYLPHQTANFSWSPDGTQIAYRSDRSGQRNIWVVTADGASNAPLTDNRDANLLLYSPLWSTDGKRLAYSTKQRTTAEGQASNFSVSVAEVATRTARGVFQSEQFARLIGWLEGDKELLVAALPDSRLGFGTPTTVVLLRVPVEGGAQQTIATLPAAYLYNIHLSADRRTVAFTARREGKDNAWVIAARGGQARPLTANNDPGLYFSSLAWSPEGKTIYFGKQSRHSLLSMLIGFE